MSLDTLWLSTFIVAGIGFGADAFFTTLVLHRQKLTFGNWIFPIFVMHSVVPASESYLLRQFGIGSWTLPVIGTLGFIFITTLIVIELRGRITGRGKETERRVFGYVLAVSWDILLGFTALQPTFIHAGWSATYATAGYLLTGAIAAGLAVLGLGLVRRVQHHKDKHYDPQTAAKVHLIGDWIAFSFIESFGIAALWQGWVGEASKLVTIAAAAIVLGLVFWYFRDVLSAEDLEEAQDLLA